MNGPMDIPSLDQLMADPAKGFMLPSDVARTMLCGLAGVLPVLIAQSSKDTAKDTRSEPEKWLTADEAAEKYGVTKQWLYRHKRQLPHSQPSRKVLLFHDEKMGRWFHAHKAS